MKYNRRPRSDLIWNKICKLSLSSFKYRFCFWKWLWHWVSKTKIENFWEIFFARKQNKTILAKTKIWFQDWDHKLKLFCQIKQIALLSFRYISNILKCVLLFFKVSLTMNAKKGLSILSMCYVTCKLLSCEILSDI